MSVSNRRQVHVWLRRSFVGVLVLAGVMGGTVGGYRFWFTHRSQPTPVREEWFEGVRYERLVFQEPRPVVAHVVRIDLQAPGIDFLVTPGQPSEAGDVFANTTSGFAERQGVQLAINANYFYPFRNNHPLDYEPHRGDPVHVVGLAASRGSAFGSPGRDVVTLYLSRDRRVSFEQPSGELWHAVSGMGYVVREGKPAALAEDGFRQVPYPRMLAAVDETGRYLLLLIVDGKQPRYSEGLTLAEAADLFLKHGAYTGIQLDGGGSATLVRQGGQGRIRQVNTPTNFRIAGWERVVATHLGIFARPLPPGASWTDRR
ncbi:phosphodiester glycosidase family protein [Hyalangium versicolor]|uniref:phosphodiester glycosidase family protein n=1 Tax=Hyalangium versicolor TaxID=2861190 RepID=UPI001CCF484D|nr:phosphodiester glycosidase family protein [Hyalangium versicolor]